MENPARSVSVIGNAIAPGNPFSAAASLFDPDSDREDSPTGPVWRRVLDKGIDIFADSASRRFGMFTDDLVGIPTQGQQALRYLNEAFPGTNPWERLGSQAASAGVQSDLKLKEIAARVKIAKIAAQGQVMAAKETARPAMNRYQFQNARDAAETTRIQRMIEPALRKMDAETRSIYNQAVLRLLEIPQAQYQAVLAKQYAAAGLTEKEFGAWRWYVNYLRQTYGTENEPYNRAAGGEANLSTKIGMTGPAAAVNLGALGVGLAGGAILARAVSKIARFFGKVEKSGKSVEYLGKGKMGPYQGPPVQYEAKFNPPGQLPGAQGSLVPR